MAGLSGSSWSCEEKTFMFTEKDMGGEQCLQERGRLTLHNNFSFAGSCAMLVGCHSTVLSSITHNTPTRSARVGTSHWLQYINIYIWFDAIWFEEHVLFRLIEGKMQAIVLRLKKSLRFRIEGRNLTFSLSWTILKDPFSQLCWT